MDVPTDEILFTVYGHLGAATPAGVKPDVAAPSWDDMMSRVRRSITVERRAQGGYTFKLEEITKADPPYGDSAIPSKT